MQLDCWSGYCWPSLGHQLTFKGKALDVASRVVLCRATPGVALTEQVMVLGSWDLRQTVPSPAYALGLSSEEQWLVQGPMLLLGSLLLGMNPLQPAFLGAVLAPGLARYGGALAGPAKAQVLCLPVAFLCLETPLFPAVWELVPSLFVSSPALGPFLWGDANSLPGRLLDLWLGLPARFGLCLLWRRREVYGVLESMAFAASRGDTGRITRLHLDYPGPAPRTRGYSFHPLHSRTCTGASSASAIRPWGRIPAAG